MTSAYFDPILPEIVELSTNCITFELGTILKRLVINDLLCVYMRGFYENTPVVFELEKHVASDSLLNVLREKPIKIALVQYTEA